MFKILITVVVFFSFSFLTVARELPVILDFLPNCEPEVIDVADSNDIYDFQVSDDNKLNNPKDIDAFESDSLQKGLSKIVLHAQSLNADAIIVERLSLAGVSRRVKILSNKERTLSRDVNQVHVRSTSKFIRFCEGDSSLSKKPTHYNSKGRRVTSNDVIVNVKVDNNENRLISSDKFKSPESVITLNSAYGVNIFDPVERLQSLGPASAKLQLTNGVQAFGYGRRLWFFVKNGVVSKITHNVDILNGHGKNLIAFSENYDGNDWSFNSKINFKDDFIKVSDDLFLQKKKDLYYKVGGDSKLFFKFEEFNLSESTVVNLLTSFVLTPDSEAIETTQVEFLDLNQIDVSNLIFNRTKSLHKLNAEQMANQIMLNEDSVWVIASDNILFGIENSSIKKIRVTESILSEQEQPAYLSMLRKFNIPETKSAFINRYPNIEDNFDVLTLNVNNISIIARFESNEDDATLVDMLVSF